MCVRVAAQSRCVCGEHFCPVYFSSPATQRLPTTTPTIPTHRHTSRVGVEQWSRVPTGIVVEQTAFIVADTIATSVHILRGTTPSPLLTWEKLQTYTWSSRTHLLQAVPVDEPATNEIPCFNGRGCQLNWVPHTPTELQVTPIILMARVIHWIVLIMPANC